MAKKKQSEEQVVKPKTLFDHIKMITSTQDPNYWDTLTEASKKTWSNYMVHRFLSMRHEWIDLISELQPYTQALDPEVLYKVYIGLIPKGRYYLKYVKGKGDSKFESWLIDLIKVDYQCSIREATDYVEILYATLEGREHIKYVCEKYGIDPKQITKLKLKLPKK